MSALARHFQGRSSRQARIKFPWAKNSALFIAGVIISIVIAEATLSVLNIPRFYKHHTKPPQFQHTILEKGTFYYVNLPSANIQFVYDGNPRGYFGPDNQVNHVTNSWGFRGNEFSYEKKQNTVRMAFLGDSFTFGEGVRQADTYPEKVRTMLNEKPRSRNINYESYNFGVGGYNTSQSLFLLQNLAIFTRPDIVVLGYALNDAEPKLFYKDPSTRTIVRRSRESHIPEGLPGREPPDTVLYKLRIAKILWQQFYRKSTSKQTVQYYNSLYTDDNPDWQATKKSLREFIGLCRDNNVSCYVLCLPILYKLDDQYPFKHLHEEIGNEIIPFTSERIHFIDLLPYFVGNKYTDLWVHPTDQHPNEVAHEIIAEALVSAISQNLGE